MNQNDLSKILTKGGPAAIAVSGGVDSMTLACVAGRHSSGFEMYHAVSPAVPSLATERVQRYAQNEGWSLHLIDAEEFNDPSYRANPVNRCYFCKSKLYKKISSNTSLPIFSGTNMDDLSDFRPGLKAAEELDVFHPFVEAGIDKSAIREIARNLGLWDLSELPAAPCLSSRVETGIPIEPVDLYLIERVETLLSSHLGQVDLRCRIRNDGAHIEVDHSVLSILSQESIDQITNEVQQMLTPSASKVRITPYVKGSSFIGEKH